MGSDAVAVHLIQLFFLAHGIALLFAVPTLDRQTRLFGVDVEAGERESAAGRRSLRLYRRCVLCFGLVGLGVAGAGAAIGSERAFAFAYPIAWVLVLAGTLVGWLLAHRSALDLVRGSEREAAALEAERRWKAGIVYYAPDDPAVLVEKRFGWGWTVNFARPAAWLLVGLPIALVLLLVLALWLAR